ncbi:hypothetical protein [Epilithonimonas lactis]|uniref:Uncharacterized protein n=1 Tax=Epilithonimonas lactis TaxID=421072 RepID=A0A085B7I0_9FLAO|nr:hypothetical protein [Epilithonimonas lactis]KFC18425.1 hypothetical protein IO89_18205 [Epilithonimonas lactis]SER01599.1 hypothetical protein SAMN04488097_3661 [Epilithonimonas lactis]
MNKLSVYILLILLCVSTSSFSQNINKNAFTEIVGEEEGDLNQDKVTDKIIVSSINTNDVRPFKLEIWMSQPNSKKLKLVVSTTKLLEQQYDAEKYKMKKNFRIPDVVIENGKLTILTTINELKSRYVFRFKDGNFELTNISRILWDGKETTTETEIDLLKGSKVVFDQDSGPNKKYKVRDKSKPKPLPKIQDLTSADLANY